MRKWLEAVALGAILVGGGCTPFRPSNGGHVYTVEQVASGLSNQPRAWIGHTFMVRGIAVIDKWRTNTGTGVSYCPSYQLCSMPVPPKTSVDIFLVGKMPVGVVASNQLLTTVRAQRAGSSALVPTVPPSLVVKVLPRPFQTTLVDVLAHVPLLSQFVTQPNTIQAGIARIYRVRVLRDGTLLAG
jgi:hypothetical protein